MVIDFHVEIKKLKKKIPIYKIINGDRLSCRNKKNKNKKISVYKNISTEPLRGVWGKTYFLESSLA